MIKPTYKTLLSEKQFLKVQQRARELRKYGTHLVNIFYDDSRLIFKTRSSTGDPRLIWTQTVELADIDLDQIIKMNGKIDYRTFLLTGLKISCSCPAWTYWGYKYMAWKRGYGLEKETRIPRVRNPYQRGFLCFTAGTPVLTATGYKPVEDIKVGDYVFTHKGRLRRVVANSSHLADETVKVHVGSDWIQCTPNHRFFTYGQGGLIKKPICEFTTADKLLRYNPGSSEFTEVDFTIEPAESATVYNFEVEEDHSYIVNGIVTSNCKHLYLVLSCLPFLAQTLQSKFGKYISKRKQELAAQQKKQDSVLRQKVQQVMNPVYDADLRYQQQVQQAVQARQELDKLQAPQYDLLNPEASAEEQRPQVQPQQYPQNTPDYDPNLDLEPDFSDEDEESIYKIIQEDNDQ